MLPSPEIIQISILTPLRVGVASVFQIAEAQKYTAASREFPFEFSLAMVWANVECHLAVFTSTSSSRFSQLKANNRSRLSGPTSSHFPQIYPRSFVRQHNISHKRPQPPKQHKQHVQKQHRPTTIPQPQRHGPLCHRGSTCVFLSGL